jgi:hypothetical protein
MYKLLIKVGPGIKRKLSYRYDLKVCDDGTLVQILRF